MRVKRYVVNDVPEALPLIRSELGKDAVILNTKEIYIGGFLGLFRKKKMEVIAAVESGPAVNRPAPERKPAAVRTAPVRTAAPLAAQTEPETATLHVSPSSVRSQHPSASSPERPAAAAASAGTAIAAIAAIAADEAADSRPANMTPLRSTPPQPDQSAVLDEIKQMKEMMAKLAKMQHAADEPAEFEALRVRLAEQEVADEWIEQLIESVKSHPGYRAEEGASGLWRLSAEILTSWMRDNTADGVGPASRIVHVVGPTGVGKTTTIAKLAAEQSLKRKRKVGFITSDTYRIAAVDQLRTYANILNVPLEVVFSPLEMARAFKQLEDRELIFMDTAGRNFRNDLFVSEVNSLLQRNEGSETFLVLSLTGKTRDMEAVASRFLVYGISKVIYTKKDETDTLGPVLNLAMQHGLKVAYITYGQNVPDDIEPFRPDSYVEQLLGASADA